MFAQNLPFKRTHDLSECAYLIQETHITLPINIETIALLTPYAVIGRYGGIEDEILSPDEAIEIMKVILDWATQFVK
ncbi:MAG: HEPN domain-containing protein [Methanomicrobiales archaeon]|nr:HEPN domain-containing protein [Methanomicrobiales archaeon]